MASDPGPAHPAKGDDWVRHGTFNTRQSVKGTIPDRLGQDRRAIDRDNSGQVSWCQECWSEECRCQECRRQEHLCREPRSQECWTQE